VFTWQCLPARVNTAIALTPASDPQPYSYIAYMMPLAGFLSVMRAHLPVRY